MVTQSRSSHKIMTKPLPQLFDDLEAAINKLEDAIKLSQAATREAKAAAGEARSVGQEAAAEARDAAVKAIADTSRTLTEWMARLEKKVDDAIETINLLGTTSLIAADLKARRLSPKFEIKK